MWLIRSFELNKIGIYFTGKNQWVLCMPLKAPHGLPANCAEGSEAAWVFKPEWIYSGNIFVLVELNESSLVFFLEAFWKESICNSNRWNDV